MKYKNYLQLFADGGTGGDGGQGSAGGASAAQTNTGYTFEQAEEIASARAEKATRAALADYFRKQGMTEEEVTSAISEHKEKKAGQQPNVSAIERERDEAKKELEDTKRLNALAKKHISDDDADYVLFKVGKMVTDKLPFNKALDEFLKDNPKYAGGGNTYRVSGGTSGGGSGAGSNSNDSINDAIRSAAGR